MKSMHSCISVCSAILLSSVVAHASSLTGTMLINAGTTSSAGTYVSGSYFVMGANRPNTGVMLTSGSAGGVVLGNNQNFVLSPDTPHPFNWDGAGGKAGTGYSTSPTTSSTLLTPFFFGSSLTYVGTNPISYQSGLAHPVATADISACVGNSCTLSMDLSAWEVMWNGSAFEQGPRPVNTGPFVPATGTYDLSTQAYSVTWASQINGGPFNGVTTYWHLEGTVVPVPGAAWLLGSGLMGLLGFARKKSKTL